MYQSCIFPLFVRRASTDIAPHCSTPELFPLQQKQDQFSPFTAVAPILFNERNLNHPLHATFLCTPLGLYHTNSYNHHSFWPTEE